MLNSYMLYSMVLFHCLIICVSVHLIPPRPRHFVTVAEADGSITLTNCPNNISIATAARSSWTFVTWREPTFIDIEGNAVISVRTHAPGSRFSVGITLVRYSVAKKGTPECKFVVRVKDEEPPRLLNCPRDITRPSDPEQNSASDIRWVTPQATDNVQVIAIYSTHPSGSAFTLGRTEVTYYARDIHENIAKCSFSIYITDEESPVCVVCPADISEYVGPTETTKAVSWRPPTFKDNSGPPQQKSTHTNGQAFQLGHTAVVYTATDLSGNTATCSFHVLLKVQVPHKRIFVRHFTMTEIEITWAQTMNKNASSYLIYVWNVGNREPLASEHVYYPINRQETFATLTINGLFPGVIYNIKVIITGIGVQLNTKQRTKPNSPGSLTVAPATLTPVSARLEWQSGGGIYDQYQLSYREIGSQILQTIRTLDKTTTRYDVDGLDPGTAYVFKVFAISGTGELSTTSIPRVLTVTTESLPEEKILVTNVTSTSVSLLCRMAQSKVESTEDESSDRGYIVIIYSDESDVFTDVVFEAWPLRYEFKSLKPHTYYHIRVVSNEMGTYFETTATTRPQPIQDIWIHAITNASVTLEWMHVQAHQNMYEINITPNYQRISLPIKTSQNNVYLQGLLPKATYIITVVAVYDNLRSDPIDMKVTPGVDEPKPVITVQELSCYVPIVTSCCLAGLLALVFLYVVKTCVAHNGKHLPSHHAEENEYENPTRPNSIYSAQYQNTPTMSRRESTNDQHESDQANLIYPALSLRIMPKRPKLRRIGYVEDGIDEEDDIPMYYNIPAKHGDLPD